MLYTPTPETENAPIVLIDGNGNTATLDSLPERVYNTRDEAIKAEIIDAIENGEATRDEYDIDTIADMTIVEIIRRTPSGVQQGDPLYAQDPRIDEDGFWQTVADNAIDSKESTSATRR